MSGGAFEWTSDDDDERTDGWMDGWERKSGLVWGLSLCERVLRACESTAVWKTVEDLDWLVVMPSVLKEIVFLIELHHWAHEWMACVSFFLCLFVIYVCYLCHVLECLLFMSVCYMWLSEWLGLNTFEYCAYSLGQPFNKYKTCVHKHANLDRTLSRTFHTNSPLDMNVYC